MQKRITVYSTPFCSPCERLKQYLNQQGVAYTAIDLMMDEDAADKLDEMGIRSSPVLEIDEQFYVGSQLNPDHLAKLLEQA